VVIVVSFALLCLLSAVLAWIDIRHGIIPDWLNLTIAGLGLSKAVMIGGAPAGLEAACEGAVIGATFWLLRRLYFAFREVQGLGLGDVKFLAAAGIWSGVEGLPMLVLVAALTALACAGLAQLAGRQLSGQTSISFGPFLVIGLLFTLGLRQFWQCC
jgi:leader peptidase (prepilin peptidase) / N-methyltransferase